VKKNAKGQQPQVFRDPGELGHASKVASDEEHQNADCYCGGQTRRKRDGR
jgi:hypothetical protein